MIDITNEDDERTKQCEAILEIIHSEWMPIKPISPIKTPPKQKKKSRNITKKLQDLFGSSSPPASSERPITPGANLDIFGIPIESDADLDINMIEMEEENALTIEEKTRLNKLMQDYNSIFNETGEPCPLTVHKINTGNNLPISSPPYRMSQKIKCHNRQRLISSTVDRRPITRSSRNFVYAFN